MEISAVSILKLVIYFAAVPMLVGAALSMPLLSLPGMRTSENERISLLECYSFGYLVYLALFWLLCRSRVYDQAVITDLMSFWIRCVKITVVVAFVVFVLGLMIRIIFRIRKRSSVHRIENPQRSEGIPARGLRLAVILVALSTIILAVFFLLPHYRDTTAATVRLALQKETIASRDPYTTYETGDWIWRNFFPLFYATGISRTELDAAFVIQYLLPVALLPVFYGIYSWIARYLFAQDSRKRFGFLLVIEVFYLCMTLKTVYVGLAVFQNIWNPETMLVSCVLPLQFFLSMNLSEYAAGRMTKKTSETDDAPKTGDTSETENTLETWSAPESGRRTAGGFAICLFLWICCFAVAQLCIVNGVIVAVVTGFGAGIWNFIRIVVRARRIRKEGGRND